MRRLIVGLSDKFNVLSVVFKMVWFIDEIQKWVRT